jgi:signal transduction histidine kinase
VTGGEARRLEEGRLRRRDAIVGLFAGALVVLALLTVFAIELSNTQAKSKQDVAARVHERGRLAAALIDSLFQSVEQQIPQDQRTYGARTVTTATMDRNLMQNDYLALLDRSGKVIASSRRFTAQARADLASSSALRLIRSGHPYGLGDLVPYGKTGAIDFAVAFVTPYGPRVLLTGLTPLALSTFIAADLRKVPGVKGARNYLLDGNDKVLASTDPATPVGSAFPASQDKALAHSPGDVRGRYYDQVALSSSTWRIVLVAPDGPLFASVAGLRKWVPWLIFAAFAIVALVALGLGRSVLRSAEEVHATNARLEVVNDELGAANMALELRAAELARSNAELEQFASIASHDLQEPLRKVRTFTQQLTVTDSERLSEKGRDYLHRANAAAERMQGLIEDLLKFSRVATHGRAFAPVDLGEVTRGVLQDLELHIARSGAVVRLGELPVLNADQLQMRQLMQNLISNALKFRREGIVPEVAIDATMFEDEMQITVRDNGIGFEPQYGQRIFRVFERLHGRGAYPGTGIGLALCRKIAERHGGRIIADGEPGVGSTFTVTLPINHSDQIPAAKLERSRDARDREGAHVPA